VAGLLTDSRIEELAKRIRKLEDRHRYDHQKVILLMAHMLRDEERFNFMDAGALLRRLKLPETSALAVR